MSRAAKLAMYAACRSLGIFSAARRFHQSHVRILCFHGVWLGREGFSGDTLFVDAACFENQLDAVLELGYSVLPLKDVVAAILANKSLPRDSAVLTIDDGWYGTYSVMAKALQQRGLPATLYVDTANLLSRSPVPNVMARYLLKLADAGYGRLPSEPGRRSEIRGIVKHLLSHPERPRAERMERVLQIAEALWIDPSPYLRDRVFAYMYPEELATMPRFGIDVQLHTHNHTIHDGSMEAIEREISVNRQHLSGILGAAPSGFRHFCYPSGRHTPVCAATLGRLGIASATTTEAALATSTTDPMLLPRVLSSEQMTPIEWEADLCGFASILRRLRGGAGRRCRRGRG